MDLGRGLLNIIGRGAEAGFGANVDIIKNDIKRRQEEADDARKRNLDRIERMRQEGVSLSNSQTLASDADNRQKENIATQHDWSVEAADKAHERSIDQADTKYARETDDTNAATETRAAEAKANQAMEQENYKAKAALLESAPKEGFNEVGGVLFKGTWKNNTFTIQQKASPAEKEKWNNSDKKTSHVTNKEGNVTIFDEDGRIVKVLEGAGQIQTEKETKPAKDTFATDMAKVMEPVAISGIPTQPQLVLINQVASREGLEYKPIKTKNKDGKEIEIWSLVPKEEPAAKKNSFDAKLEAYQKAKAAKSKEPPKAGLLSTNNPPVEPTEAPVRMPGYNSNRR